MSSGMHVKHPFTSLKDSKLMWRRKEKNGLKLEYKQQNDGFFSNQYISIQAFWRLDLQNRLIDLRC